MATALAEVESDLVICGCNREPCEAAVHELKKIGVRVLPVHCDIAKADDIVAMRDDTLSHFGRADVLLNNAGRVRFAPLEKIPLDRWEGVMRINMTGTFLYSQAFGAAMIAEARARSSTSPPCPGHWERIPNCTTRPPTT
jgi:gluconate 5-dehydrogenase